MDPKLNWILGTQTGTSRFFCKILCPYHPIRNTLLRYSAPSIPTSTNTTAYLIEYDSTRASRQPDEPMGAPPPPCAGWDPYFRAQVAGCQPFFGVCRALSRAVRDLLARGGTPHPPGGWRFVLARSRMGCWWGE